MCLSVPVKIIELKDNKAIADSFGKKMEVGIELVEDIQKGDYAIVSNGFIIKKISAKEAKEILKIVNN